MMKTEFETSIPVCLFGVSGCALFGLNELEAALAKHGASLKRISHISPNLSTSVPCY